VPEGEHPEPRLKGDAVEKGAPPSHTCRRSFEIVGRREMSMMIEMNNAVGMSAAKRNQLDCAE
jgi:hypothetical protein